ncbi:VPLPA-CTERM sorting domain-containing protein [Tateyamaria armeniaca]|uniref:VPLPA-CTERM sorting domain-containing protein n=1 Tax=Tateyamaria armeniaca TaxID=2518930 RepID=A0ABW8UXF1_9RHOB
MKLISKIAASAIALALMAGGATAATFTFTEGNGHNRKLVAGSIDLNDANTSTPGFELDDLAGVAAGFAPDDVIQLHGRIVSSQDVFSYTFAFAQGFKVEFDLDGYLLAAGFTSSDGDQSEALSGLVGQNGRGGNPQVGLLPVKGVEFTLAGGGTSISRTFQTDVISGDPFLFSGIGGVEYTLTVDGSVGPAVGADALYDLKISAVPLPAGGLLLLGGLGGLAALRRRKGKANA